MRGLPKCYLLHTNPSEFRELGKTHQATCFPLSTLNHWSFTEHTSWPFKPWLSKFPWWDSWAWIMSRKMRWCAMSLNHGLWCIFVWIWALLGFKRDFSKIHDNVDVVQVANEMKPCGVKNLSLTFSPPSAWSCFVRVCLARACTSEDITWRFWKWTNSKLLAAKDDALDSIRTCW